MKRRVFLTGCGAFALTGCGASMSGNATSDAVARAGYVHSGPPALTLFTMVNNNTGAGAHTSLMINASQRVIFDPAGSVRHESIPEINDVLYGITPYVAKFYASAHARKTYHAIIQRREVSPQVAEMALQMAQSIGPVGQAQCALKTSGLLAKLPGFEPLRTTWFPVKLAEQFGELPGTVTRELYENDADDKAVAIAEYDPNAASQVSQAAQ